MQKYHNKLELNYQDHSDDGHSGKNIQEMAKVFARTAHLYHESMIKSHPELYNSMKPENFWVLFVVDEGERNVCDQKWIEYELFNSYKIPSMRMTLS